MSRKTIVTCDLCNKDIISDSQTWDLLLYAECGHKPGSSSGGYDTPRLRLEICRPCLDRLGIIVTYGEERKILQPTPTIEDIIREIVANAVEELR